MSKAVHGPWKADTDNWIRDSKGETFISVPTAYRTKEEVFAIRDLIAAAPEMLEALRWTQQTVHQAHHDGDMSKCEKNTCLHIRGVISKAEGRSEG